MARPIFSLLNVLAQRTHYRVSGIGFAPPKPVSIDGVNRSTLFVRVMLLVLTMLSGSCVVKATSLPDTVFIGTASLTDGRIFTYKLCLNDSAGMLIGYSVMDLNGPQETRAGVTGSLSQNGNQILFRETGVESSKYKEKTGFCILQGSLKIKHFAGTPVLKGHFEGFLDDTRTVCASGKLILISPRDALKILSKSEAAIDSGAEKDPVAEQPVDHPSTRIGRQKAQSALPQPAPEPALVIKKDTAVSTRIIYEAPPQHVLTVMPGKTLSVDCLSGNVTLEVWDNKDIDGDIITLMEGNKALIKNLTLTGTHYSIVLNIKPGQTETLHLIAVSEGSEPLNTARIRITSGTESTFLDVTSTIDKEVLIVLKGK